MRPQRAGLGHQLSAVRHIYPIEGVRTWGTGLAAAVEDRSTALCLHRAQAGGCGDGHVINLQGAPTGSIAEHHIHLGTGYL